MDDVEFRADVYYAIWRGEEATVRRLLHNKSPNFYYEKQTPLILACRQGNESIVRYLIERGADIHGEHLVDFNTALDYASQGNSVPIVRLLLDTGAPINRRDPHYAWTPLHRAVMANKEDIVQLLIDRGADVNVKDYNGWTPLHLAARWDASKRIFYLLDAANANINAKDLRGMTPLELARDPVYNRVHSEAILNDIIHSRSEKVRQTAREAGRVLTTRLPNVIRGLKAEEQQLPFGQVRMKEGKYDTGLPPGIPERIGQFLARPAQAPSPEQEIPPLEHRHHAIRAVDFPPGQGHVLGRAPPAAPPAAPPGEWPVGAGAGPAPPGANAAARGGRKTRRRRKLSRRRK